jgi:nucleotide-binding universal stress UspA family protein
MDTITESGRKTKVNKKKTRAPKVKRKFAVRDVRVGSMLMLVLAIFAVLIAAVGGMAAFFLNQNYHAVLELGQLTDRVSQVQVINGNMLRAAIPVLQFASAVRLHTVTPDADVVSVEEAAQYLSRHGIHPIITTQHDPDHAVDALLRIACGTWHAAYCLMGAYGRSRISEAVFGGTTCGMLKHSRIPLLLGR